MMLNQQQNEHDDQHQPDNAAWTVPPAPASGKRAHEEDDQQDEKDGGEHGGTPEDLTHNAQSAGAFRYARCARPNLRMRSRTRAGVWSGGITGQISTWDGSSRK
jgi:hypothetical protein